MNIVIPVAGNGTRLKGYSDLPKPFIDVEGLPMIRQVINSYPQGQRYIVLLRDEYADYVTSETFPPHTLIRPVHGDTEGAACTVMLAADLIDNEEPLLIADCDSIVPHNQVSLAVNHFQRRNATGGVTVRYAPSGMRNLSYASLDNDLRVLATAEKKPISDMSSTGPYWWRHGRDFLMATRAMIENNDRTNGEFYVSPAYNYHIEAGGRVYAYPLCEFWHLGSPPDLKKYLSRRQLWK